MSAKEIIIAPDDAYVIGYKYLKTEVLMYIAKVGEDKHEFATIIIEPDAFMEIPYDYYDGYVLKIQCYECICRRLITRLHKNSYKSKLNKARESNRVPFKHSRGVSRNGGSPF